MIGALDDASDGELTALALAGRQEAYRALLARHREPIFRSVRASVGDPTEALDVTQEVFISAFAALSRYDPDRPFIAWLRRIALNKCRDWARRRAVRSFFTRAAPLDESFAIADPAASPEIELADRAELARASAAIATLPSRLRETLLLRTVSGLTQSEAADILGVTEKTVETRLYRARSKLKLLLEP